MQGVVGAVFGVHFEYASGYAPVLTHSCFLCRGVVRWQPPVRQSHCCGNSAESRRPCVVLVCLLGEWLDCLVKCDLAAAGLVDGWFKVETAVPTDKPHMPAYCHGQHLLHKTNEQKPLNRCSQRPAPTPLHKFEGLS